MGIYPDRRISLLDLLLASPRERKTARSEAFRYHQLHGEGASMWLANASRAPNLPRRQRRIFCLASWYLGIGVVPPEHWCDLDLLS